MDDHLFWIVVRLWLTFNVAFILGVVWHTAVTGKPQ